MLRRLCLPTLLLLLAALAPSAWAQALPTADEVRDWAGLPKEIRFRTRDIPPAQVAEAGKLLAGRSYDSDETRYGYVIELFAPGSYLKDHRAELPALVKKLDALQRKEGFGQECGSHQTHDGHPYSIFPGGMGPGGGSLIVLLPTPLWDVVIEQIQSDEGHPLDQKHEAGPEPTRKLSEFLESFLSFLAAQPATPPTP